jgi:hypothetical protein
MRYLAINMSLYSEGEITLNIATPYYSFDMSEPVILNWERVIHKNVRSKDGYDIGNIISEAGDMMTVMQGASREYNIPKSAVEAFNGSEVLLSLTYSEVGSYKVA